MRLFTNNCLIREPLYENEEIDVVVCRERESKWCTLLLQGGKLSVQKTGFVYADAQTVQLARLNCNTLRSLSLVNTHEK